MKKNYKQPRIVMLLQKAMICLLLFACNPKAFAQTTLYVDQSATGANNGSSWSNAFTSFGNALDYAWHHTSVQDIHIAEGTYVPNHYPYEMQVGGTGTEKTSLNYDPKIKRFHLRNGLHVFGGYASGGASRNTALYPTVLSGALSATDTCYNVVFSTKNDYWATDETDTTMLDGVGIKFGRGSYNTFNLLISGTGSSVHLDKGLGYAHSYGGNIKLNNVEISHCESAISGSGNGAIFINFDNAIVINCLIHHNKMSNNVAMDLQGKVGSIGRIDGNFIHDNIGTYSGQNIGMNGGNFLIENNNVYDNTASILIAINEVESAKLLSNNISNNAGRVLQIINSNSPIVCRENTINNNNNSSGNAIDFLRTSGYGTYTDTLESNIIENNSIIGSLLYLHRINIYLNKNTFKDNNSTHLIQNAGSYPGPGNIGFYQTIKYNKFIHNVNSWYLFNFYNFNFQNFSHFNNISNNLFIDNEAQYLAFTRDETTFNNNTIFRNKFNYCFYNILAANMIIANNIIYKNTDLNNSFTTYFYNTANATLNISNNLFAHDANPTLWASANTTLSGNLFNINPLFLDTTNLVGNDNYWGTADDGLNLQNTSPCINVGNNSFVQASLTHDLKVKDRIKYSIVDMGAYENQSAPIISNITACINYTWPLNNQTYTSSGTYTFVDASSQSYTLNLIITNSTNDTSIVSSCNSYTWSANNVTYNTSGTYSVTTTNSNGCTNISYLILTITNASPTAPTISQPIVANTTSCNLSWNAIPGAALYYIWYRPVGNTAWLTPTTSNSSITLTGLLPNTLYEVKIRVKNNACALNGAFGSLVNFSTQNEPCYLPTSISASIVATNKINFMVSPQTGIAQYNIWYKKTTASSWLTASFNAPTVSALTSTLTAGTYEYKVRNRCTGSNLFNAFGPTQTITIGAANKEIHEAIAADIKMFPNPTASDLTVELTCLKPQNIQLKVIDVTGKLVSMSSYNAHEGINQFTLPMKNYANALYIIQVIADNKQVLMNKVSKHP